MTTEKLPVLCCNDPSNLLGHAPAGLELRTQEWEETDDDPTILEQCRDALKDYVNPGQQAAYIAAVDAVPKCKGLAYVGEQLELSEWLDLPGFEPEPEIHLRRALEHLDAIIEIRPDEAVVGQAFAAQLQLEHASLRRQIKLARKPKRPRPRTWKEPKK